MCVKSYEVYRYLFVYQLIVVESNTTYNFIMTITLYIKQSSNTTQRDVLYQNYYSQSSYPHLSLQEPQEQLNVVLDDCFIYYIIVNINTTGCPLSKLCYNIYLLNWLPVSVTLTIIRPMYKNLKC